MKISEFDFYSLYNLPVEEAVKRINENIDEDFVYVHKPYGEPFYSTDTRKPIVIIEEEPEGIVKDIRHFPEL